MYIDFFNIYKKKETKGVSIFCLFSRSADPLESFSHCACLKQEYLILTWEKLKWNDNYKINL